MVITGITPARIALAALLLWLCFLAWPHWPVHHEPGILVQHAPLQKSMNGKDHKHIGPYDLTLLAAYDIKARVLSARDYRGLELGDLVPLDLALGWGPMSNSENLEHLRIRQSSVRTYGWRYEDASLLPSIKPDEIHRYSANVHIIPANDDIMAQLFKIREGDIIRLEGYLVNFKGPEGSRETSTTRNDTGAGSCEIIYVEALEVLR